MSCLAILRDSRLLKAISLFSLLISSRLLEPLFSVSADAVSFGEEGGGAEAAATEAGRGEKPGKPKEGAGRDEEEEEEEEERAETEEGEGGTEG